MLNKDMVHNTYLNGHYLYGSLYETNKNHFTIVIPVLNEEEAISKVIKSIKRCGYHNILVVDGHSNDKTVEFALRHEVKVILQNGIGKTGAIKTAIENVTTPFLIIMDGDCTYDPKDIKNFFDLLLIYDQVIGSRTFGTKNIPILNRFGNTIINITFNILFGTNLIDVCSGMYALRTNFAKNMVLNTKGFDVEVEIASQSAINGSVTEVPINYYTRIGKQKLQPWKDGIRIMTTICKLFIRARAGNGMQLDQIRSITYEVRDAQTRKKII